MTGSTERPTTPAGPPQTEAGGTAETLAALRRQMAVLEEQLDAVNRQQAALRMALNQLLARFPEAAATNDTGGVGEPTLQRCAADVVRVLREVRRPLGPLEILEEMTVRHLSWRESTVRQVLAGLKDRGVVREGQGERPHSFELLEP